MARIRVQEGNLVISEEEGRIVLGSGSYVFEEQTNIFDEGEFIEVRRFYRSGERIFAYTNQGMVDASTIIDHCGYIDKSNND